MIEDSRQTQQHLANRLANWGALKTEFAKAGYTDAYVICDASERVLSRIDQPRVPNMPSLRYAPADPAARNWTIFDGQMAKRAIGVLDAQAPAFAPHRVLHLRSLADEQAAAAAHGLELLMGVDDPYIFDSITSLKFG